MNIQLYRSLAKAHNAYHAIGVSPVKLNARYMSEKLLVKHKNNNEFKKYSILNAKEFNAMVTYHAKMHGAIEDFPVVIGVAKNAIPIKYKDQLHDLEYDKQKSEFEQSEMFNGVNKVGDVIDVVKKYNANEEAKKNIDIVSKKIEAQVLGIDNSFSQGIIAKFNKTFADDSDWVRPFDGLGNPVLNAIREFAVRGMVVILLLGLLTACYIFLFFILCFFRIRL